MFSEEEIKELMCTCSGDLNFSNLEDNDIISTLNHCYEDNDSYMDKIIEVIKQYGSDEIHNKDSKYIILYYLSNKDFVHDIIRLELKKKIVRNKNNLLSQFRCENSGVINYANNDFKDLSSDTVLFKAILNLLIRDYDELGIFGNYCFQYFIDGVCDLSSSGPKECIIDDMDSIERC